jgi:hypothetical protein
VITYRATLDVPRELAQYLGRLLHAERRRRGTRKTARALTCFRQAVLGLRWFRQNTDVATLARDHGISRATGYRYLDEVIAVLADQAPDLHEALQRANDEGTAYLILDGKVFSADRCGEQTTSVKGEQIDVWYSGKAHEHGGNPGPAGASACHGVAVGPGQRRHQGEEVASDTRPARAVRGCASGAEGAPRPVAGEAGAWQRSSRVDRPRVGVRFRSGWRAQRG